MGDREKEIGVGQREGDREVWDREKEIERCGIERRR